MRIVLSVDEEKFIKFTACGKDAVYALLQYAQFLFVRVGVYSSRVADNDGRMPSLRDIFAIAEEVTEEERREIDRFFSRPFQSIATFLDRSVKEEEVEVPSYPTNISRYYAEWVVSKEELPVAGENYLMEEWGLVCLSCGKKVVMWSESLWTVSHGDIQHGCCDCGWGAWAKVHVYNEKLCDKYSWLIQVGQTPPCRSYKKNSPISCKRCGCDEFFLSTPQRVEVTGTSPRGGDRKWGGSPAGYTTSTVTIWVTNARCAACNLMSQFVTDKEGRGIIRAW